MASPYGSIVSTEDIHLTATDSEARHLADPEGTLPEVELRIFEKQDIPRDFSREKADIVSGGQSIGWCDLITDYQQHRMHFDFITLDTDRNDSRNMHEVPHGERPKGQGLAAYLIAIETARGRGYKFESQDGDLSLGSNRLWEVLVQKGVAKVIEAPKHYQHGDIEKVIAKYQA